MIAAAKLDGETEDQVVSLPSPRGQLSLERKPELPQANLPQRPVAVPTAAPSFRPTELASLGGLLVASEKPVTPAHARSVDALASVPLNVFASPQGVAPAEALQPVRAPDAAEIVIEQQLDMAAEGEWLDQLARDIASAGPDAALLRFRLNPETLGSLRVEIRQDQGGTAVRFTADNETARTLIAEAQPRLIAEARAQGIRVSETHVDLGGGQGSGDPRRQQAGFEEPQLRTARLLQEGEQSDGNPTAGRSERYA
jgi:flagellar hook-length control protein FliK